MTVEEREKGSGADAASDIEERGKARSIWPLKPWWCQPWSIVLTGLLLITGSWVVLHRWWITMPAAAAVLAWWWLFLVLVPGAYRRGELEA